MSDSAKTARRTARPTSMRERLARAAFCAAMGGGKVEWKFATDTAKARNRVIVDAILTELQEPSEETLAAGARATMDYPDGMREATCWVLLSDAGLNSKALAGPLRAMIQHIKDGGS